MKKIVIIITLILAVSCDLMDFIPIGTRYGPDDYFFFTHRIRTIVLYEDIVVSTEVGKPKEWNFTVDAHQSKLINQEEAEGEDKEFFDAICEKYGDVGYNRKELKIDGGGPDISLIIPDLLNFTIYSDKDFDESHPAGTLLSDCFMVYAFSNYSRFHSEGRDDIKNGLLLSDVLPNDLKMLGFKYKSAELDLLGIKYNRYELEQARKWKCLMKLKVVKKPTLDTVHNLTFEFQDEYGKTYTSTLRYDFSKNN